MNLGNILGQILQQGMGQQGRSRLDHAMGPGGMADVLGGLLGGSGPAGVAGVGRPLHGLEHARAGMLQRHVQIGQYLAFRHQWHRFIDMRIRVDIMQSHPDAQFAQCRRQTGQMSLERPAVPKIRAVTDIHSIGTGILRHDQQFLDPGPNQILRLP